MAAGRYAPSPSGDLHIGNLRTAMLAWLFARGSRRPLLLRFEDLDAARTVSGAEQRQLADMQAMGISFDGEAIRQSQRLELYREAVEELRSRELVYECFCTRREIQDAPRAPHSPPGAYPGTCRALTEQERRRRREDRPGALRLRAAPVEHSIQDVVLGQVTALMDDVVLVRNDGTPAYNLAVVVDDHLSGVDQVVRADDLASSAPRQDHLRGLLYGGDVQQGARGTGALPEVEYAHVPLVVNAEGKRLAKRDGAVTLETMKSAGWSPVQVRDLLLDSLGLSAGPLESALPHFSPEGLPGRPWVYRPPAS